MSKRKILALLCTTTLWVAASCGDDDDDDGPVAGSWTIDLAASGLDALASGTYEGWLIFGDEKVSTGTFSDPASAAMATDRDPNQADAFVVTIEPTPDNDPEPSGVVVLSGDIASEAGATLTFGVSLDTAAGGFILRTPTDDSIEYQLTLALEGLEDLSEGVYEGWLIYGDEKVSTGTFSAVAEATANTQRDPSAADMFVLTIEPAGDTDPEPSGVVVLAGVPGANGTVTALTFGADLSGASGGFILRTPTDDPPTTFSLDFASQGLEVLSEGVYEGWLIVGEDKISTGTFKDPAAAAMTTTTDPATADMFVLTIEPDDDADPDPSGIVVLSGAFGTDGAPSALSFGADLSSAAGGFFLRTPTDDATNATPNDEAGVWFIDPTGPMMAPGLSLPALPAGWVYEGWAVTQGTPLTTGRFSDPAMADLDAPFSDPGPPFPGEDFLTNLPMGVTPPVNLADGSSMIVISVEPDLAGVDPTGPGPFAIKPLALPIPENHPTVMFTALGVGPQPTVSGTISYAPVTNDEAGVWFLEMTADGPVAALNLPELPAGWVYEGWAVTQGTPLTTGRFSDGAAADVASPFSDGGPPFPGEDFLMDLPDGVVAPVNLADGNSLIVISVEPDIEGVDPTGAGPFAIKPLAFAIPAGHPTATFTELGQGPVVTATGSLTVTEVPSPANDEAGVWFLEMTDSGPSVGLTLPTLPDGWVYEGWAVTQGVPLSTGRFTDPAAADLASPFSDGGPPFPGEDFLSNLPDTISPPVNLADGNSTIVISIEPDIAGTDPTGAGPFAIKPLALDVPADLSPATYTALGVGPSLEPEGMVSFSVAP